MLLNGKTQRWSSRFDPLLLALLVLLCIVGIPSAWGLSTGFSPDTSIGIANTDWMKSLPDDYRISHLSIPGTHNTMAADFTDVLKSFCQCQSMSLAEQLKAGIRVLDIRNRHMNDRFYLWHGETTLGNCDLEKEFGRDVLEPVANFLSQNPTETVLMRVNKEYSNSGNSRNFLDTYNWYLDEYDGLPQSPNLPYRKWVWQKTRENENPTLGEVRGKIVILDDFPWDEITNKDSKGLIGIDYPPPDSEKIQDNYNICDYAEIYRYKWNSIYGHLNATESGSSADIYINYLSGSMEGSGCELVTPIDVAGGHLAASHDLCTRPLDGTNNNLFELLRRGNWGNRVGIIMADFPGAGLVQEVIKINFFKPIRSISPATMNFGNVEVNSSSKKVVTISNPGGKPLTVSSISLSNPNNFTLDTTGGSAPCNSQTPTINPGTNCTVAVAFTPYTIESLSGTFTIKTNDPFVPNASVSMSGTGTAESPSCALSSLALNPSSLEGTHICTGTVTLDGPAPSGGAVVTLLSDNPSVAKPPDSVTVPEGSSSATFAISTEGVSSSQNVEISAEHGGITKTASLEVTPLTNDISTGGGRGGCSVVGKNGVGGFGALILTVIYLAIRNRRRS